MAKDTKITCPKCGNEFNVEDVLAHQIEEKYRGELNTKITAIEGEYKIKELHEVIESMKGQMDEMKRKAEQGDMRLQGEVQELALEEILRSIFPFDIIEEVGKGIKGDDVIHTVRNKLGIDCGKILYES